MKILYAKLNLLDIRCIGATSSVVAFPLWSLQKQNDWVKRIENNMKDIIGIPIV